MYFINTYFESIFAFSAHIIILRLISRLTPQECIDKLIRELLESKKRVDEISEELTTAEEQLAASRESRKDLTKCVDHLTTMEYQNRMSKEWRAVYERLSAKITDTMSVKNQLLEVLSTKEEKVKLIKRSTAEDVDELRVIIGTLKANLVGQAAKEDALRRRIAQLEASRRPDSTWQNRSTSDSRATWSPVDRDRCASLNRDLSVNDRDLDLGKHESTAPASDNDEYESSSSTVDDNLT